MEHQVTIVIESLNNLYANLKILVETSETCSWTSTSTCSTMYFNAHGQYNVSWNGQVYFEVGYWFTNVFR